MASRDAARLPSPITLAVLMCLTSLAFGQGLPTFSATDGGQYDTINLQSGAIIVSIPVRSKAGLVPFSFNLVNNNQVMSFPGIGISGLFAENTPVLHGWSDLQYSTHPNTPCPGGGTTTLYDNFSFIDSIRTSHSFDPSFPRIDSAGCLGYSNSGVATDNTGLTLTLTATPNNFNAFHITYKDGLMVDQTTATDPNGNQILFDNLTGNFMDSLGQMVLNQAFTSPPPQHVYTYTDASGNNRSVTVTSTTFTLRTIFNCPGKTDAFTSGANLSTGISLPDGTSFGVTYEQTPGFPVGNVTGRIKTITLPTGGTITYNYTGGSNGINCSDLTVPTLTRTTTYGTTTYVHSGTTTTVTDPTGNDTVYTFDSSNRPISTKSYQGSAATGTMLLRVDEQYTGTNQVTEINTTTSLPGVTFSANTRRVFDAYGNVTLTQQSDFGASTPTITTAVVYGSWNGSACVAIGNGIVDKPCSVIVTPDGAGNPKAKTLFTYDANGKTTQIKRLKTGTGTYLSSNATYDANGAVHTTTDSKGTLTTYTNGQCNVAFPTTISSGGLSTQATYDCNGGVSASTTDANGKVTVFDFTTGGADPFWRLKQVTDPSGAVSVSAYSEGSTLGSTWVSSYLSFGSSISGSGVGMDVYGRPVMNNSRQGPGSGTYDTVATTYDANGRVYSVSTPCATGGWTCSTPVTTQTYDALGRPLVTTSPINGTVTNTYTKQDVLTVVGPAPAGEATKQRQYEYDGLGRLKSVCEITSDAGSGPCGQAVSATGFLTSYSYDTLGRLTDISQSGQARHFTYDLLGRMLTEQHPESGTTTYVYDSATGCNASSGDLVKKTDAVGNVSCYNYDALHRNTSITYSGPYAANTPTKTFVYDAATVNGAPMTNTTGRMAEAYTGAHVNDLGFSYSVRGELSEVYQNSPNSGGWYHTTASYFANGVLNVLGGVPGKSAWTYGVDPKGRPNTVVYGAATNLVTASAFNSFNAATSITLGSGDIDTFMYGNAGQMTKYQAAIGATPQNVSGTLTWNANGSVKQLVVADPFNAGNVQTCAYLHDALGRLNSAQCGTPWAQTFSYDAFGNLKQAGSLTFQPTYGTSNRYSALPGCGTLAYDANGNLLNDCTHTYTYDVNGNMITLDNAVMKYDALGRLVEDTNTAGVTKEILYSPIGKLGNMNGQSVQRLFIPLIGGTQAFYFGANQYYTHPDWLGSSRFISTSSRTMYNDLAFSPFGRAYANAGTKTIDFTGQQQESFANSSGDVLDFDFRKLSQAQGRWFTPDPVRPFSLDDPQSFNLYAYVGNTPLTAVDPLGLVIKCPENPKCANHGASGGWGDGELYYQINGDPYACDQFFGCTGTTPAQKRFFQKLKSLAANNGTPQIPTKTQERLERLKNCALGYYGIDPLSISGATSNGAKWGLIALSAGGIPKSVASSLGLRVIMQPGASEYTSALSMLSLAGGGGALRTIANFGSKWAGPIAIASVLIDATAIGICTASD